MSMQSSTTTKCRTFQHPEFIILFDSAIPQPDIDALASFLEQSVKEGAQYVDGELIAFGSMLLRIDSVNGSLVLQEPDLISLPITWTLGVTRSIKLLRLQKDIAASVGLDDEIDPPSIQASLLVGTDLAQQSSGLVLDRMKPVDSDSGWFVGRGDSVLDYNDEAHLNRISVYQAILNWPQISGFLALPPGCRVEISAGNSLFERNGKPLSVKKGSFVDILANETQLDRLQ